MGKGEKVQKVFEKQNNELSKKTIAKQAAAENGSLFGIWA